MFTKYMKNLKSFECILFFDISPKFTKKFENFYLSFREAISGPIL